MLHHLSFPGDHKALQINSEQRNWQQSHYCSRIGDKAPRAPQGTVCGLSAAIWKWSMHRKMRVLPENVWNLCDLSEQTHREYQRTSSETRQTGFSPSCSSLHMIWFSQVLRSSFHHHLIALSQSTEAPLHRPRCPGGWRMSSLKVITAHFLCHQAEDEPPHWSSAEWIYRQCCMRVNLIWVHS